MGLYLEDDETQQQNRHEKHVSCWTENWLAFMVFVDMQTQWNVSQNGVVGLRYESIPGVMEEHGVEQKQRAEIRQALRVMEKEALAVFNRS